MTNITAKTDTQASVEAPDEVQKAKDATALMIEIDTKKKADEDLATRLAGFANSAYGQPLSEELTESTEDPN
jgi:YbbR domain-containing protein